MYDHHIVISTWENPAVLVVETEAENVTQVLLHHRSRLLFVENTFLNIPYQNSSIVATWTRARDKLRNKIMCGLIYKLFVFALSSHFIDNFYLRVFTIFLFHSHFRVTHNFYKSSSQRSPEMSQSPSFENSMAFTQPKWATRSLLKRFFDIDKRSLYKRAGKLLDESNPDSRRRKLLRIIGYLFDILEVSFELSYTNHINFETIFITLLTPWNHI